MFNKKELEFLLSEFQKYTAKSREHLQGANLTQEQREKIETRMITVISILNKLEKERDLQQAEYKETPRVLLVDDVESVRLAHKQFLASIGFKHIELAEDGEKALSMLKEADQTEVAFGLVICDWEMPKMSGVDLLRIIRMDENLWKIPMYLISSRDSKTDISNAINLGATGYMIKPVSPKNLQEKIGHFIM